MEIEHYKEIIVSLKDTDRISALGLSKQLNINIITLLKEIRAMRKKGYEVRSNLFCVYKTSSRLSKFAISRCARRYSGIAVFDVLSSTNDYLKENPDIKEGSVVVADEQIRGRGRNNKAFSSPKGKGIYLSYLIKPDVVDKISSLTPKLAVCVLSVLKEYIEDVGIKWVNDIVYNGKKLCGILTEIKGYGSSEGVISAVLGIGINVNTNPEDFQGELKDIATSLSQIVGININRNILIGRLIKALDKMNLEPYCSEEDREIYNDNLVIKNKEVYFERNGREYQGICRGVDESFRLIVRLKNGEEMFLDSGEVSVRGLYGYIPE